MAYLANPKNTVQILEKYNFSMQKRFGQNFLIDSNIVWNIVEAAEINVEDTVIEIGPGIGTMTQFLCEKAGEVFAVEIDKKLIPILEETLSDYKNIRIINEDILKLDLTQIADGKRSVKVVANLPYYITTPIIMKLLEENLPIKSITVMVQKEVAERMRVGPGTKDYGALSLAVQYYAKPEIVAIVPKTCFIPKPNVDSAVIRLTRRTEKPVKVNNTTLMFAIIRAVFNQRRKTMLNSLGNAGNINFSKEEIRQAIEDLGLRPDIRGEALTLEQFAAFSDALESQTS
ncbi:16S rRNA (adenine(1518)-N(6)/adenine(1519)-N(6))-dimethyltransferase RsmA [Parasporobacterium paucivorans]|uniref:Ribosomal RNA small subunit methyltransferase A n=1 Tax=Parasporobacterium paucivorans DSM 15970 TaxID=1122934 RepID=A0A1M6BBI9_9FIRM|nr:16S rRNA (adenine(1518)-N(6)/adenine(1519)-N(6))-dimethyltransferase RsmA [Parasporobacterium paucivorans]SHI46110.1 16S rRNA (adenine1518-N6/adenine1519-N6)-dimethyltransferase [Parasporobacterium paucivorans DSM 15970]